MYALASDLILISNPFIVNLDAQLSFHGTKFIGDLFEFGIEHTLCMSNVTRNLSAMLSNFTMHIMLFL